MQSVMAEVVGSFIVLGFKSLGLSRSQVVWKWATIPVYEMHVETEDLDHCQSTWGTASYRVIITAALWLSL